jgi:hypothetical protein
METVCSSDMLVSTYHTVHCRNQEYHNISDHACPYNKILRMLGEIVVS